MRTYRTPQVCRLSGASYRQIDYWARTDLVTPSIELGKGSGYQRVYSYHDLWRASVVKLLLDAGLSLSALRGVLDQVVEDGRIAMPNGVTITIDRDRLAERLSRPVDTGLQLVSS